MFYNPTFRNLMISFKHHAIPDKTVKMMDKKKPFLKPAAAEVLNTFNKNKTKQDNFFKSKNHKKVN